MRPRHTLLLTLVVAALALLSGLFFLLPRANCCDEPDKQLEQLTARAKDGHLDAISQLYDRAKREGVKPLQEHWSLEGALRGDKDLRSAFIEAFETRISPERQERILSTIRERSSMPGAPCLLELLESPSPVGAACK